MIICRATQLGELIFRPQIMAICHRQATQLGGLNVGLVKRVKLHNPSSHLFTIAQLLFLVQGEQVVMTALNWSFVFTPEVMHTSLRLQYMLTAIIFNPITSNLKKKKD